MIQKIYTTAPEAYDGFSTATVAAKVGTDQQGKTIRLVEMEARDYDWQTSRYSSGLYAAFDESLAQEMFDRGMWTREANDGD